MSVTDILNVSKTGIYAAQNTLQTVSHNISNANTPGYSRQAIPLQNVAGGGGGGVHMAEITKQIDKLVDRRQELGTGELGRLSARDRFLTIIEQTFNDMGQEGLSQRLDGLYAAADSLADNPTNPIEREQFVAKAGSLGRYIQEMHKSLSETNMPVDQEIDVKIADINNRLKSFRDINNQIIRNSATDPALDLKDQRRRMILELGALIDIQTLEMPNDGIQVMASGGQLLADPVYAAQLARSSELKEGTDFRDITLDGREIRDGSIKGGEMGGLLDIRDQVIHGDDGFLTRLESLADEIRFQFNKVGSVGVSQSMFTSQASSFDTRRAEKTGILDVPLLGIPAKAAEVGYDGVLLDDLQRVVEGDIVIASGADADNLTLTTVHITPKDTVVDGEFVAGMSVRGIMHALNSSGVVRAVINRDNRLQLSASGTDYVYGIVSDTSNSLAALGIGGIFSGSGARDMDSHTDLQADSRLLGVSKLTVDDPYFPSTVTFDDGNNEAALAMSNIRNTIYQIDGNNATLMGHYATTVGILGSTINQNKESLTAQEAAQDFVNNMRESISGVSMEEELTDLIRFQRAFQASSKMVTVANELMQTVISMV